MRVIHPSLQQVERHFRRQPSESQIGLLTACAVLRVDSCAREQLGIPKRSALGLGGCQAHSGIKKAPTRRNLISPLRNSGKPRVLFHSLMQREVNPQRETLQFTSLPAICIRSLYCVFLLACADGKQKSFVWKWLTHWYAMVSAAEQDRPSFHFSLSFLSTVIMNEYTRMCVCVCACAHAHTHAHDYKSCAANGLSILPAMSFHA